jgi:hypothetical protein
MSKLNRDVLYSIFEELKDDKKALLSCLLVNRTWCEIIVPIFWKNPWKHLKIGREESFINVIILHLSNESKNNLNKFLKISYNRPLFDYISFCKDINLTEIENIINHTSIIYNPKLDGDNYLIYKEEIFKLFINSKTKSTNLYIPIDFIHVYRKFSYKIHLIPEAKECFSEIEFLMINEKVDKEIFIGLSEICKSIRKLELSVYENNVDGIIMLINAQKNLKKVCFTLKLKNIDKIMKFENSLIKHGKTIECIKIKEKPTITNIFSHFENLKILKVGYMKYYKSLQDHLAVASLPFLQVLNAAYLPTNILTSLIEKTKGYLKEISLSYLGYNDTNNKRLIQTIYQNCPNLKYFKLVISDSYISEFENLLVNCEYLDGLYITMDGIDWGKLFEILTRSSPTSLFKFKFCFEGQKPESGSLDLFFYNWKGRHPMLLQTIPVYEVHEYPCDENLYYIDIIEKYKAEGLVKKYDDDFYGHFKDFEWIRKKF